MRSVCVPGAFESTHAHEHPLTSTATLMLTQSTPTTACAKCAVGRCQISLSNFVKNPVTLELYCKTHYMAKFRVEGKYLGSDEYARN